MVDYDLIPAVRRSDLWEMRKSPAHYLYKVTHQEEPTPALLFGTAAHKFILEEESFWDQYIMAPEVDRRTKAGKAEWAEFLEKLDGKCSITGADLEMIEAMNQAIMANSTAVDLLKTGRHEVPITWMDPETGELCKCRPDVLTEYQGQKYIVDYKTTTSCEDGAFEYSCRTYGYKLQAGMYAEGVFHAELEDYGFAFVAQEKKAPYSVPLPPCRVSKKMKAICILK
jgi:ATP-dependent exoDNAse (exonuclease V) beta subunit